MIRILPFAIEAVLLVFCLIDCVLADDARVRNLPKWAWILLVIVVPLAGGIAWLVAGRPVNAPRGPAPGPSRPRPGEWEQPPGARVKAPDDDPEFLASLKKSTDHERLLKQWEEDLRRRERDLRSREDAGPDPDPGPEPDDR